MYDEGKSVDGILLPDRLLSSENILAGGRQRQLRVRESLASGRSDVTGVLDRYRANWPRVGALVAMGSAGTGGMTHGRMSKPQLLSSLNMLALIVHQYEEYEDPGYFLGQFNGGVFHRD